MQYKFLDHIHVRLIENGLACFDQFTNDTHIIESSFANEFIQMIDKKVNNEYINQHYPSEQIELAAKQYKQLIEACLSLGVIDMLTT